MQKQPYIVLSRKYRPLDFNDVVGQKFITDTLNRAISSGRLSQALLFCGPRGVGKTTCARILAKKINELSQNTLDDTSNDFNTFELDAASNNSVDDIRSLIDQLRFAPQKGRYKIYIIDEVHMLSQAAFNAFLKTLEEPPSYVIFILATTEKHKVIPTILSRCQIYDFRHISLEDIYKKLKKIAEAEGIKAEQEALYLIAQRADGALRDALLIFDRLISFSGKTLTPVQVREQLGILDKEYYFKVTELILAHNIRGVLILFNEILQEGFDGRLFINSLAEHLRYLIVSSDSQSFSPIEVSSVMQTRYIKQSSYTSENFLLKALQICQRAEIDSKLSLNPRLSLEISLIHLASLDNSDIQYEKKNNIFSSSKSFLKTPSNTNKTTSELKSELPLSDTSVTSPNKNLIQRGLLPPIKEESKSINKNLFLPSFDASSNKNLEKPAIEDSSSVSFSILEALKNPTPTESINSRISLVKEPFLKENFKKTWEKFSKYQILSKNFSLYGILNTIEYEFSKNNLVILCFPSRSALTEFSTIHESILNYLRYHLNNYHLYFKILIKTYQKKETIYTPEKKFTSFLKKNSQLKYLKESLSLDFDN